MKTVGIVLLVIILIGAIMFATNPKTENFENFIERKNSRNINKYVSGSSGAMSDLYDEKTPPATEYIDTQFGRKDYYVISVYKSKTSATTEGKKYLGVFRVFLGFE